MPHSRSIFSRQVRTARALRCGFAPICRNYVSVLQVPSVVASATAAASVSLYEHFQHDRLTDECHHYGYRATSAALQQNLISKPVHDAAQATHKRAGKLKHSISRQFLPKLSRSDAWADMDDDTDSPLLPPLFVAPLSVDQAPGTLTPVTSWEDLDDIATLVLVDAPLQTSERRRMVHFSAPTQPGEVCDFVKSSDLPALLQAITSTITSTVTDNLRDGHGSTLPSNL